MSFSNANLSLNTHVVMVDNGKRKYVIADVALDWRNREVERICDNFNFDYRSTLECEEKTLWFI